MSWVSIKLKELGEFKNGANYPKGSYGKGTKIVNVKDLFRGRYVNYRNLDELKPNALKDQSIYLVSHGDLLFTRSSLVKSGAGMVAMINKPNEEILFCGFIIRFRPIMEKASPLFLLYLLRSPNYRKLFTDSSVQTNISNINQETLGNIEVKIPSLFEQERIIILLNSLDSKIELNNKINAELESMAKTIYDYWFVQFDFPDKNGKPYKTSGGKMVWNDELKRDIPEGWEVKDLGEVVEKTGTGLNPRDNFKLGEGECYYVTIKSIAQGKVLLDSKCDRITEEALDIINRRSDLKKGDILFTSIQPVGVTYLLRETPKNWNINESVFTIRPNYSKLTSEFLYMFLSGDFIKAYTENVSAGSIHKGIRHTNLKECKFVLPQRSVIDDYTKIAKPIFEKLHNLDLENQKLAELRDWLLPMLVNGQVKVNE